METKTNPSKFDKQFAESIVQGYESQLRAGEFYFFVVVGASMMASVSTIFVVLRRQDYFADSTSVIPISVLTIVSLVFLLAGYSFIRWWFLQRRIATDEARYTDALGFLHRERRENVQPSLQNRTRMLLLIMALAFSSAYVGELIAPRLNSADKSKNDSKKSELVKYSSFQPMSGRIHDYVESLRDRPKDPAELNKWIVGRTKDADTTALRYAELRELIKEPALPQLDAVIEFYRFAARTQPVDGKEVDLWLATVRKKAEKTDTLLREMSHE
jgi:hypothetical protein